MAFRSHRVQGSRFQKKGRHLLVSALSSLADKLFPWTLSDKHPLQTSSRKDFLYPHFLNLCPPALIHTFQA